MGVPDEAVPSLFSVYPRAQYLQSPTKVAETAAPLTSDIPVMQVAVAETVLEMQATPVTVLRVFLKKSVKQSVVVAMQAAVAAVESLMAPVAHRLQFPFPEAVVPLAAVAY